MTSLLYPRLPPAVARGLFNGYRGSSPDALAKMAQFAHPDAVFAAVGGVQVTEDQLRELAGSIRGAANAMGYPKDRGTELQRQTFDQHCAEVLHTRMGVVAAEAASIDVWAFIGAVLLPDVCVWRFPDPPEDRVIGPDLTRHTFARLWWRAYQLAGLDPGDSLSALASIPESEMNQLFERRTIGGDRALVQSLARALMDWHPDWTDAPRRLVLRDAASRIRRLLAFAAISSLGKEQLDSAVRQIFASSAAALAQAEDLPSGEFRPPHEAPVAPDASRSQAPDLKPRAKSLAFDDVTLAEVPAQIAEMVNELGGVPDNDLVHRYEERFGVQVPAHSHNLLRRFAWSAKGRQFIQFDEANQLWLPGPRLAGSIAELGDWTITKIRQRARQIIGDHSNSEQFQSLLSEVYRSDGKRIPKLVMSLVGRVLKDAGHDR